MSGRAERVTGVDTASWDPAAYLAFEEPRSRPFLDLFADLGWSVDAWETTYLHVLHGEDPVFAWIAGTGARPVLQALPPQPARPL